MSAKHTLGQTIIGRCVTMGSKHTGTVAHVICTPAEYTVRYRIVCEDGRSRVVFSEGVPDPLEFGDSGAPRGETRYWYVKYHGVVIFNSTRKAAAQQLHDCMRVAIGRASLIGLSEGNLSSLLANVDERVSLSTSEAQEETAVAVDLGLNRSEHDFEPAVSALPHDGAPAETSHRSAALHFVDDKTHG